MHTEARICYAHSKKSEPLEKWQPLDEHLRNTAELAGEFAEPFGGRDWARAAGLLHDLGKGSKAFQAYIRRTNGIVDEFAKFYKGRVDHSTLGAQRTYELSRQGGLILAYALAGHHSGLMNWSDDAKHGLKYRLEDKDVDDICPECLSHLPLEHLSIPDRLPSHFSLSKERFGFQLQFFARMIFSCLVDADFLDTEAFLNPEAARLRVWECSWDSLRERFWRNFNALRNNAAKTEVNRIREDILDMCLSVAEHDGNRFSLTVPTGGGKTLSSLAFALKRVAMRGRRRIIYVVPFTSIIEQNARVFRDMLGEDAVLEHHCNVEFSEDAWKNKLAAENWDAPVIVTTNVQFFDSFFSNKASKCRKLHNVANSVVIFDEVQAIPVERLKPCIEIIGELSLNYNTDVVLCSATQPAIEYSEEFKSGLSGVKEIISEPVMFFAKLKRVTIDYIGECSREDIAGKIREYRQVLCVVNTKPDAHKIFSAIEEGPDDGSFHLSASMCPAHRSRVLSEIRRRLKNGDVCRVVSTQLVEAGVDLDFPIVFRALSGLDSIAQAAGRCNREGRLECGEVFVFKPSEGIPAGYFRQTAQVSEMLLERFKDNLFAPPAIREYFLKYYWKNEDNMDKGCILSLCDVGKEGKIYFEDIAKFRMIDSPTVPVVIPFDDNAKRLIDSLPYVERGTGILRRLQRYAVQVYEQNLRKMSSYLEDINGINVLVSDCMYDARLGLLCDVPEYLDPQDTIV